MLDRGLGLPYCERMKSFLHVSGFSTLFDFLVRGLPVSLGRLSKASLGATLSAMLMALLLNVLEYSRTLTTVGVPA